MTTIEQECSGLLFSIPTKALFGSNDFSISVDDIMSSKNAVMIGVATFLVMFLIMAYTLMKDYNIMYHLKLWLEYVVVGVPSIDTPEYVRLTDAELLDDGVKGGPCNSCSDLVLKSDPDLIQCYDPSTKQKLGTAANMTAANVDDMIQRAKIAQSEWQNTTYRERRTVLRTIQKYITSHVEIICRVSARETGKPKIDAALGEVLTTCEKIRTICEYGELWLQPEYRPTGPMMMHKTAWVEYKPLGVIVAIAPWNYPFHNSLNHIISALFAGNAHIGKVSEHASWSAKYFGSIVKAALEVNGHNPDLVQTVTGMAESGHALVNHPDVDKIIFTGSTPIGRKVMETASKNLTPVILELGGKDAMVIRNDVNVKSIVPFVLRGCYQNAGQNCVGVERVMVYESIVNEFLDLVVPKIESMRQGNPLENAEQNADGKVDIGAMIMPRQLDIVQELVDDAVAKGATLHCGGKRNADLNGQFFEPTVLSGVASEMKIFHEEVFGPVMSIIVVPNDSDEECIKLVNACQFGLGSSIFSGNQARGLEVGRQFETGMLTVNDYASNYLVQSLPFGGCKSSGFGRFAGIEGLRALCLERSILIDTVPFIKTAIPTPLDYPIDSKKGFPLVNSIIQLFYDESLIGKIKAIIGLIKFS